MNSMKLEKGDVVYTEMETFSKCECCKQDVRNTHYIIAIYVKQWMGYHIVNIGRMDLYWYLTEPITLISKGDFK